jgi:hypothetical protein
VSGFLPVGYTELAAYRDRVGVDAAGGQLAGGLIKCYRLDPWGQLHFVDPAFWRSQYAAEAMANGHVPRRKHLSDSGQKLLVKCPETANTTTAVKLSKQHRPRGRSFVAADEPLVERMEALIGERRAASPTAAARILVKEALGGGSPEAKIKRLVRAYGKKNNAE